MVKLILDTNQIVEKDWRLRSATIRLVEKAVELGLVSIVVPEIVVEETRNKFRQRLESHVESAQDNKARVEKLLDAEIDVSIPQIDDECKKYGVYLDERLEELKVSRPAYANIDHKWLVSKAFGPRRPFRDGDRGYRDALVWHSVLHDVASPDHQTYFVSNNKKDFGDQDGGLHPDLVADLNDAGLQEHVTYTHDLQTFVDNVVKPALEKVPSPLSVEGFEDLFEANLDSIIDQMGSAIERQGLPTLPYELFEGGPYIEGLGLVSAESGDAYALDDTSYYTAFDVLVEASFDQTVYYPDAIWIAEEWGMSITGGDEKHTELSFTFTIPLAIAVVTSMEQGVEPEIFVELKEFYGFCRHCEHPVLSDAAEQCSKCGRAFF